MRCSRKTSSSLSRSAILNVAHVYLRIQGPPLCVPGVAPRTFRRPYVALPRLTSCRANFTRETERRPLSQSISIPEPRFLFLTSFAKERLRLSARFRTARAVRFNFSPISSGEKPRAIRTGSSVSSARLQNWYAIVEKTLLYSQYLSAH